MVFIKMFFLIVYDTRWNKRYFILKINDILTKISSNYYDEKPIQT